MAEKKNFLRKYTLRLIGVILLIFVLSRMDWPSLGKALQAVSIKSLLLVIPLFLLMFPVKSLRWFYILRTQRIGISGGQAFGYYTSAIYWGLMTPGKLGEFIKVYYLSARGISTGKAVFSVLVDRGVDVFFLLILSVVGVMQLLNILTWTLAVVLIVVSAVIFMVFCKYIKVILKKSAPLITKIAKKLKKDTNPEAFLEELNQDIDRFTPGKLGIILVVSFLSWVVYVVPLYYLGTMLRLDISAPQLVIGILLSSGISMLPISIGGVGTRDSFLILYLGQYGILKEKAVVFSLMFVYMYVVAIIFSWLVYVSHKDTQRSTKGEIE